MNKIYVLVLSVLIYVAGNAQKIKEVGFSTSSLQSFGLSYKFGTMDRVWNLKALNTNGRIDQTLFTESTNLQKTTSNSISVLISREYRKSLNSSFEFYHGIGLNPFHNNSRQDSRSESDVTTMERISKNNFYGLGLNYIVGGNILLKGNLVLSLDISPYISYTVNIRKEITKTLNVYEGIDNLVEAKIIDGNFRYGITLNNIVFTLAYRIKN